MWRLAGVIAMQLLKGGLSMKLQEIRQIAETWGVDAGVGRTKLDIIRDIQISEGYEPCFRTKDSCENECLWKKDCTNHR